MASFDNVNQHNPLQPTAQGPNVPAGLNTPPAATGDKFAPTGHTTGAATGNIASTEHKYATGHDATRNVPPTLDVGPAGYTPVPQHQNPADNPGTGYMPDRHLPAQTGVTGGIGPGATTATGGPGHVVPTAHSGVTAPAAPFGTMTDSGAETVLTVTAPDLKTIYVTGPGTAGYTLTTTFEHHNELVTIRHGAPSDVTKPFGDTTHTGTHHAGETVSAQAPPYGTGEAMAPLATVELHQLRATKVSLRGGEMLKLKDFLGGRGTNLHTFEDNGIAYEWRKGFHGLTRKLELFAMDKPEHCIAWATKGHGLPAAQDPNYTSAAPHLHDGGVMETTGTTTGPQAYSQSSATHGQAHTQVPAVLGAAPLIRGEEAHQHGVAAHQPGVATGHSGVAAGHSGVAAHTLPQNPANSTITLTRRATEIMDMVVLTFLLIDRETREDPLH